jgi:hypothetical protein
MVEVRGAYGAMFRCPAVLWNTGDKCGGDTNRKTTHEYRVSNSSTEEMGSLERFATNTCPVSFSRTGSFGACPPSDVNREGLISDTYILSSNQ